MTTVGITGHQEIPTVALAEVMERVEEALNSLRGPLQAATSLAVGADQLVAGDIVSRGGRLHLLLRALQGSILGGWQASCGRV